MRKCTKCGHRHKTITRSFCPSCYNAWLARRNPERHKTNRRRHYESRCLKLGVKHHKPIKERFFEKTKRLSNGCLIWTACKDRMGYGYFGLIGGTVRAHRFAYELAFGPMSPGLETDHLCRNASCVEPTHLEAVTRKVNTMRGDRYSMGRLNRIKTHCPRGHVYDEENTYRHGNHRYCKACHNIRRRKGFEGWRSTPN